ncbi:MAG: penicillin-binding protein 2, partial [Pseudomonadota bacterium]
MTQPKDDAYEPPSYEAPSYGPPSYEARPPSRDDWRLVLIMAAFIAAYAVVGVRLGMVALSQPSEPRLAQSEAAPPVRGAIVDRQGRTLAANLPAWSLYVHPDEVRDPAATAAALAPIFDDLDATEIERRIRASRRFAWVKRPVTPRQKQAILDLVPAQPALKFGRRDMRVYPAGRMAAHVLGQVRAESERVMSAQLVGNSGIEMALEDALGDPSSLAEPVALSLDLAVQSALTEVLAEGIAHNAALRGSAVVMDVQTGEIPALVSLPDFDPNARVRRADLKGGAANPRFNQPVKGVYELGSVFKVLTAAIALETGVAGPDTLIETGTPVVYRGSRIRDLYRMPAKMPVTDIVRRSSNIGSARLAMRVGTPRFRDYLDRLGLLEPTGLELPEARSARPLKPSRWTDLSTMTISFGHGLSVSPLHLVSAYATLANGGRRVTPSLLKGGRPLGERVFSERTSADMMAILRAVVERGTGRRTDVAGYEIGGKTG